VYVPSLNSPACVNDHYVTKDGVQKHLHVQVNYVPLRFINTEQCRFQSSSKVLDLSIHEASIADVNFNDAGLIILLDVSIGLPLLGKCTRGAGVSRS
jgi:hypothetical protein